MNQMANSFFSDPKVWVAILAVIISIINFIALSWFRWDQNRRWDEINIARVELSDVYFIAWEEMYKQTAISKSWGYKPSLFSVVKDHVHTDRFRLLEELVLWDNKLNKKIEGSNGFHTVSEAPQEAKRLGLTSSLIIMKHMQMQIDFKNIGSTVAKNVQISVDLLDDGSGNSQRIYQSTSKFDLYSNSSINVNMDIWLPINGSLPKRTTFNVNLSYLSCMGKEENRSIPIEYDSEKNYWVYGT